MKTNTLRVIVRGINWSGSGAVVDLLREYDGFAQVPGGLPEIATVGIMQYQEFRDYDLAINQTLGESITDEQIKHLYDYILIKKKLLVKDYLKNFAKLKTFKEFFVLNKESYLIYKLIKLTGRYAKSLNPDLSKNTRVDHARKWVNEIISTTLKATNSNSVIFDHTVDLSLTTHIWPDIFSPFKIIIVIRNPYDQYLEKLKVKYYETSFRKKLIGEKIGADDQATLKYFLGETSRSQEKVDRILETLDKNIVMVIKFEDLITRYDEMKLKIENFLGIDSKSHVLKRKYLDPSKSINNIGLYNPTIHQIPEELFEPVVDWYLNH